MSDPANLQGISKVLNALYAESGYAETFDELLSEVESLRAKLAAVRQWQQSWSDSEDRLLLLPEASTELAAILRSQEPPTGQEQP